MSEKKIFWMDFIGGIIQILGIIGLFLCGYLAIWAVLDAKFWALLTFVYPTFIYLFGWMMQAISGLGAAVNNLNAKLGEPKSGIETVNKDYIKVH